MIKLKIDKDVVDLSHGSGGRSMHRLLEQVVFSKLNNEFLLQGEDQAILPHTDYNLAFTTDTYVINPYFFPGGDIGSLAVNGTINDLAVGGATPLYLSLGLILEEGFPLASLQVIVESIAASADRAKVKIVTGDTKVVERGKGDGIFINTSGIGILNCNTRLDYSPQLGDKIIINGSIANHGIAIMSKRANLSFSTDVISDSCNLNFMLTDLLQQNFIIRCMRDPTRGGIAATLNEWAHKYDIGITLKEESIPVDAQVRSASELLGLDPLFIANEGKVIIVCAPVDKENVLAVLHRHPQGAGAREIGEITAENSTYVNMQCILGGIRRIDWLSSEQLPRIC